MSRSDAAVVPRGESLTVEQDGDLRPYLQLSALHGLLNLVTLTVFRFWGRTRVRRRLWNSTYLNDDPLFYQGRGAELLLGFLIRAIPFGVVALVVLFGVWFLAGPGLLLVAPAYLLIAYGLGFASFVSAVYLASCTSWRGFAFDIQGSPFTYALAFTIHAAIGVVTLGWWWPTAQRQLSEMLWSGLRYGGRPFSFEPAALYRQPVYGAFAIGWFVSAMATLFVAGVVVGLAADFFPTPTDGENASLGQLTALGVLIVILLGVASVAFAPYRAARLRTLTEAIGFEDIRCRLLLTGPEMTRLRAENIALMAISLGALSPYVQARTCGFLIDRLQTEGRADLTPPVEE